MQITDEVDQLRVQLAGVSVAALGGTSEPVIAKEGDYGWSVAYQDTLDLRRKFDQAREALERIESICDGSQQVNLIAIKAIAKAALAALRGIST